MLDSDFENDYGGKDHGPGGLESPMNLHREAMDVLNPPKKEKTIPGYANYALDLEKRAAELSSGRTQAILYMSAANIAFWDCNDVEEAKVLLGIAGEKARGCELAYLIEEVATAYEKITEHIRNPWKAVTLNEPEAPPIPPIP